jgi:hypothetical protein
VPAAGAAVVAAMAAAVVAAWVAAVAWVAVAEWAAAVAWEVAAGGGGGYGGGGRRGESGEGQGATSYNAPQAVVRWESSTLVRDAVGRVESKEFTDAIAGFSKDYYIVSVVMAMPGRGGEGGGGGWQGGGGQQDPEQAEARRKAMEARMLQVTSIKRGTESIAPDKVESLQAHDGRVTLFLFPRSAHLETGDKDISFETAMRGVMVVKAKFNLKEMDQGSEQGL